jgi:hypothetical protein
MYCPNCGTELHEDLTACPACGAAPVEEPPAEPDLTLPEEKESLLLALTPAALVGVVLLFLIRSISTLLPGLFHSLPVAQITAALTTLCGFTLALFFADFYCEYPRDDQPALKTAAALAVLGTTAVLWVELKNLLRVFHHHLSLGMLEDVIRVQSYEIFVPLVGVLFLLYFFIRLTLETRDEERKLSAASRYAAFGSVAAIVNHVAALAFYFNYGSGIITISEGATGSSLKYAIMTITGLLTIFSFGTLVYFLVVFHKQVRGEQYKSYCASHLMTYT